MIHVDARGRPDTAAAYRRLNKRAGAGKGDLARNNSSQQFRDNYDAIDWGLNALQRIHRSAIDGHGKWREGMGEVRSAVQNPCRSSDSTSTPSGKVVANRSPWRRFVDPTP